MKVLVVGGAGYIGSIVTRTLWERGDDVTVFDSLLYGGQSLDELAGKPRFCLTTGDLRDEAALRSVVPGHDAVCHFAAIVGEPACNRNPALAFETNWQGTKKLVDAAKAAGVKRFVFSSTCSNYGVTDRTALVKEDAPLKPLSAYSESKVAAECDVLAAAAPEFAATVLRFSTAFGVSPRMRFDLLVSDFTLAAVKNHKIVIYGEQFWRPFVHIRDIAVAVGRVLDADPRLVSGEVFNVGSNDANVQKLELGRLVQHRVPGTEIELVRRTDDPRSYRVDFSKIQNRLEFRADWSIDDGIRELQAALAGGAWDDPTDRRYYN